MRMIAGPEREIFDRFERGELFGTEGFSLDPSAGGTYNNKPIYDLDTIIANSNRTGYDWYTDNYGELEDGVLNFGFWNNIQELQNSYYTNIDGTIAFSEAFNSAAFLTFTPEQRAVARTSIALWDDLVDISFQETKSGAADITFGNTDTGGAQAYAYLPFGSGLDALYYEVYGFEEVGRLGGDIWIDGGVASNFFPLKDSYYSVLTMIHEIGHALALSHPGDYNGGGFNYADNAEYAQDTLQYSVMSYWDAYETGAQHIDWTLTNFAYAATPLVHDIASIQAIYGADTTTRTGDTVYGFNSTADRAAYDFDVNTRPIVAVWDAGGIDTLDFSGWDTPSVIDLNEGAFSSGGGIEQFLTLEEVNANRAALGFAPRSQATFDFYEGLKAQLGLTSGLFKDNISIAYGVTIENAIGGGGNDLIIVNSAANAVNGGEGLDTISYALATGRITANLALQTVGGAGATGDTIASIEGVIGTAFADTITGNNGDNFINGGASGDTLAGAGGVDTISYATSAAAVTVNLTNNYTTGGDAARDRISGFENIEGSASNDTLTGNAGSNVIDGGDGNDSINGSTGDDTLNGDGGNDTVRGGSGIDNIDGGDGNDTLLGENGNDIILGGAGNDTLNGGSNNDTLDGQGGDNILTGGSANDRFVFSIIDGGKDVVTDFRAGLDKIDVSLLDAISSTAEIEAFTFIGGAAFSAAGQLRTFSDGGIFSLGGDTDGDGLADLVINLTGIAAIMPADIIFA